MTQPETPKPEPGQIWADNDPRSAGRHVVILALTHIDGHDKALVAACYHDGAPKLYGKSENIRTTFIRLDRFQPTKTGYRYTRMIADAYRSRFPDLNGARQ